MFIQFDTDTISETDKAMLRALVGETPAATVTVINSGADVVKEDRKAEQAKKAAPAAKKAAAPKAAPAPQEDASEDADEDVVGAEPTADDSAPTLDDAIDRATELVKADKLAEVKAALKDAGVKKVGELPAGKIAGFLTALEDE